MQLTDIQLKAGIPNQVYSVGRYVRILSGTERLQIRTGNGHSGQIITGVGIDLAAPEKATFDWVEFTSPIDQTITVLISQFPTTDSRLSGDVDVNGLLSVVNAGGSQFTAGTVALAGAASSPIFAADPDRLVGTFQADVDVWIGPTAGVTDGNGILVSAGATVNIENTATLYGYSLTAGTVRILESLK